MHYAYPPRKSSNPPPYLPRSSRIPRIRRGHLKPIVLVGVIIIGLIWLFSGGSKQAGHTISGKPPVVLVTVFDDRSDDSVYKRDTRENRMQYAEKHGYGTLLAKTTDYDLGGSPSSWSKVVAMRHALAKYPDCKYVWYLEQNAFIMNPHVKVEDYVMGARKLEANMIKELPVVPPDSIIKTFSHLKGDDVEFVITQDKEGLAPGSFIIKNGEWAKFFLDTWFDPLYRSYNFQKAETHALEHIVQWHPTILSKLAIVPQRIINAYSSNLHGEQYKDGDIAVVFARCSNAADKGCAKEAERFTQQWRTSFSKAR
ncbi:glycosyltransferase family 34 protein [Durotheca rogersii]|uniref:glycosyltransferase family 34 protein n=1 Tax=Durotheca rogersii TaxID=419775 RepID=UPI00221E4614|nr:glycosyltransferase family 34 protein [Durotheca rogersii]KAI5863458.1 glycosyltransferase family 34 protein [Durotheca rogersii]